MFVLDLELLCKALPLMEMEDLEEIVVFHWFLFEFF